MKAATTHVGTGGNPKIGVPVGFIRPSPHHSFFPPDSPNVCLTCLPSLSQALGTKSCLPPPYEDTSARAETALLTRLESEGYKAPLVREAARAFPVCSDLLALSVGLDVSVLPHKSVSWSAPLVTLSGVSSVFCFPVKTDKTQQQHLRLDPYPHSITVLTPTHPHPHRAFPRLALRILMPLLFSHRMTMSLMMRTMMGTMSLIRLPLSRITLPSFLNLSCLKSLLLSPI